MTSKKHEDDTPKRVPGIVGADWDVEHPEAGAPVQHEQFEPDPVDAPEKIEKEVDK